MRFNETDPRYEVVNDRIKKALQHLARKIAARIPPGWGFTLLVFEFSPGNSLFYISNAQREDMIRTMQEWIARNRVN